MAKVKIQGHASGTGILTVTAPNTSTDRTITLPDATGTLLNSDGSAASLTSIPAANITGTLPAIDGSNLTGVGGGKILQVVSAIKTDTFTSTGTASFVDITDLTATITPATSGSKILVLVNLKGQVNAHGGFRIVRDSTAIAVGDADGNRSRYGADSAKTTSEELDYLRHWTHPMPMSVLDSPATDSAVTYKVQAGTPHDSSYTIYVNRSFTDANTAWHGRPSSNIVLMEVAE